MKARLVTVGHSNLAQGDFVRLVEQRRRVDDLIGSAARPHRLTACARVEKGHLTYERA